MIYDMLKPRLPLLIYSLGISLAVTLIRIQGKISYSFVSQVLTLTMLIFSTLNVLKNYAPKVFSQTQSGIGFNTGIKMIGGASTDGNEDNEVNDVPDLPQCNNCDNPYSNASLMSVIQDQVAQLPEHTKTLLSMHPYTKKLLSPRALARTQRESDPLLPQGAQVQIIDSPHDIQVRRIKERGLCEALERAGFDPRWTMADIAELKRTKQGRDQLESINHKVKEETGIRTLTNGDIASCYPHYITDYICRKGPDIATKKPATAMDTVAAAPAKDKHNIFPGSVKHCHWDSLKKDLDQSITESISSGYNIDQQQKLITTLYYLKLRAELEMRNLINMFQSKTKIEWLEFFRASVEREPKGFHIEGTTYYIPWDLFRKYDVCFGGQRL